LYNRSNILGIVINCDQNFCYKSHWCICSFQCCWALWIIPDLARQ